MYLSEALIGLQLCLIDAVLILAVLAGYFAAPAGRAAEGTSSGWAVLVGFAAFPLAKLAAGLYPGHGLARAQRFRGSLLAVGVGNVLLAAISRVPELLADTPPRGLVAPALLTTALLLAGDPIARRALLRLGRWCQPVFIFGGGDTAGEVVRQLKLYPELGYRPACIVDDGSIYTPDEEHGVPVVRFRELSKHADELAAATTAVVIERLVERSLMLQLYTSGIFERILLVPGCHDLISLKSTIRRVGGTLSIEVASDRPGRAAALGKRVFDLVLGGCALLVLSPVFLGLALAVRLDSPGPSFSRSPAGAAGAGPSRPSSSVPCTPTATAGSSATFCATRPPSASTRRYRKLDDDPRITRVGRAAARHQPRRTSAAPQRRARRDEHRRAAPLHARRARQARAGARDPERGAAGHHRLLAGLGPQPSDLSRADRDGLLLRPQPLGLARSLDHLSTAIAIVTREGK